MNCKAFLQPKETIKKQSISIQNNFHKFLFLKREQSFMTLFINFHSHIKILKTKIEKTIFHILFAGCYTANKKAHIKLMWKWKKEYFKED